VLTACLQKRYGVTQRSGVAKEATFFRFLSPRVIVSLGSAPSHALVVHGGLARAGKVRGQTPKVDPAVKAKAKRGRALKRIQYNKRFFSAVVQAGGRKKGPNAQVRRFLRSFSFPVLFSHASCYRRCPRPLKRQIKGSVRCTFFLCPRICAFPGVVLCC
jgi:small subunit ribosomal protein S30e